MRGGRVVADGTPEQLWSEPADAWVASFLGMPNVLDAVVGGGAARTAWGVLAVPPGARGGHVVVPPGSVRPGPGGAHEAVVVARTFLGDRVRLTLRAAGRDADGAPELVASVPVDSAPAVGTPVLVDVVSDGLLVLP